MLRVHRLPGSLVELLEAFRPCFSAPTFTTFVLLAAGLVARPAGRTVCGMLAGAGLGGVWHHSRAHRFFASARWSADAVGLVVLGLVTGWLIPAGAPVVIAVDDSALEPLSPVEGQTVAPHGVRKGLLQWNVFLRVGIIRIAPLDVLIPFFNRFVMALNVRVDVQVESTIEGEMVLQPRRETRHGGTDWTEIEGRLNRRSP